MTLVVARIKKDRISIAADTLVSQHDCPLPMGRWVLKSICPFPGICVSFCNSPDLAFKEVQKFRQAFPSGANYKETLNFFTDSSKLSNNDYIIAFSTPAKLVSIKNGVRVKSASNTHWIGDKIAFERFRECEGNRNSHHLIGRAVPSVIFADELDGSPASDLFSTMRNVISDTTITSVGGFVSMLSNRDGGFRYSVYSDFLNDWPEELKDGQLLEYTDKIDLSSSGENSGYSVSQISPDWIGMNAVAFYVLSGGLLVAFCEMADGTIKSFSWSGVEPGQIPVKLDNELGFAFRALCFVASSDEEDQGIIRDPKPRTGLGIHFRERANTMGLA